MKLFAILISMSLISCSSVNKKATINSNSSRDISSSGACKIIVSGANNYEIWKDNRLHQKATHAEELSGHIWSMRDECEFEKLGECSIGVNDTDVSFQINGREVIKNDGYDLRELLKALSGEFYSSPTENTLICQVKDPDSCKVNGQGNIVSGDTILYSNGYIDRLADAWKGIHSQPKRSVLSMLKSNLVDSYRVCSSLEN